MSLLAVKISRTLLLLRHRKLQIQGSFRQALNLLIKNFRKKFSTTKTSLLQICSGQRGKITNLWLQTRHSLPLELPWSSKSSLKINERAKLIVKKAGVGILLAHLWQQRTVEILTRPCSRIKLAIQQLAHSPTTPPSMAIKHTFRRFCKLKCKIVSVKRLLYLQGARNTHQEAPTLSQVWIARKTKELHESTIIIASMWEFTDWSRPQREENNFYFMVVARRPILATTGLAL